MNTVFKVQGGSDTIRNVKAFRQVLPFDAMKDSFSHGIYPSDIDAEVERRGHFLWQEWKARPFTFDGGQDLAHFKRLRLSGKYGTLCFVRHRAAKADAVDIEDVEEIQIARFDSWRANEIGMIRVSNPIPILTQNRTNPASFLWWLTEWFRHAEGNANAFVQMYRECGEAFAVDIDRVSTKVKKLSPCP